MSLLSERQGIIPCYQPRIRQWCCYFPCCWHLCCFSPRWPSSFVHTIHQVWQHINNCFISIICFIKTAFGFSTAEPQHTTNYILVACNTQIFYFVHYCKTMRWGELVVQRHNQRYFNHICDGTYMCRWTKKEVENTVGLPSSDVS